MAREDGENEFRQKLLAMFVVEAREHLDALSAHFLALEKTPAVEKQRELLEAALREAHSLKGAARAVNRTEIEAVCQLLETLLGAWKRQAIPFSPELFDELHATVDTVNGLLAAPEAEQAGLANSRLPELSKRLESLAKGVVLPPQEEAKAGPEVREPVPSTPVPGPGVGDLRPLGAETVRISAAKLNKVLLQAEELVSAKLTLDQRAAGLRALCTTLSDWRRQWTKYQPFRRVLQRAVEKQGRGSKTAHLPNNDQEKSAALERLLEFLEANAHSLTDLEHQVASLLTAGEEDRRTLARLIDDHLQEVRTALLLPFSSLLEPFPRIVRSLARDQGKEVELVLQGGEIEIDRRLLEAMKDPLIHLVRNCIDHGIEKPEERGKKNKPVRGTISLVITQTDSSHVEICLTDDGAGVDIANVGAAASRLGLLSPGEADKLSPPELLPLIFASGVSTSRLITDISGRGLGLAIVREKVESLGGSVFVETKATLGSTFRLVLPLKVATFRGLLVRADGHLFAFPATEVDRVSRVGKEEIKTVENRETVEIAGRVVSLVRLQEALQLPGKSAAGPTAGRWPVVLVGSAEQQVAFLVDEVLADQELLIKRLPWPLVRVPNVAAATLLGRGKVVPILHVPDLLKSAARHGGTREEGIIPAAKEEKAQSKSVLVVEDSVTARALLKNILEAGGFAVETAVDGVDAFTKLRTGAFDIVVSDVDMPRMNGFDLTAKIRSDKKSAELPVVLVTALESRENRERGIEVGANAYIVKSSFDQSNLLEVLRRLV